MSTDNKGLKTAVSAPRPRVRGSGSDAEASRRIASLTRGIEAAAGAFAGAQSGGVAHIPRLRLRLPAGATEGQIAQAFKEALLDKGRRQR